MLRLVIVMAALLTALPAVAGAQQRFLTEEAAVTRILDVANERMALMPGVAATKWQTHAPVADPKREQVVIEIVGYGPSSTSYVNAADDPANAAKK